MMGQFGGLEEIAFGHQLQPVGDVVVDRALPFAIRVAAGEAAFRLIACAPSVERPVDLFPIVNADLYGDLGRIVAGQVQELKYVSHGVRRCWVEESLRPEDPPCGRPAAVCGTQAKGCAKYHERPLRAHRPTGRICHGVRREDRETER